VDHVPQFWKSSASDIEEALTIHHICGGLSLVYESNMGLDMEEKAAYSADEILDCQLVLAEESFRYLSELKRKCNENWVYIKPVLPYEHYGPFIPRSHRDEPLRR
jgi:hypothetical protein